MVLSQGQLNGCRDQNMAKCRDIDAVLAVELNLIETKHIAEN